MPWILLFVLMVTQVGGESVIGGVDRHRIGGDLPTLSEWNHMDSEFQRHLIIQGGHTEHLVMTFAGKSEVGTLLTETCRKCMVAGDIHCLTRLCMAEGLEIPNQANNDVRHEAFATGTSIHADILCSLCKSARDVTCATRLCVNPERDKLVEESDSVECMQGYCRWQKDTVARPGYNNYNYFNNGLLHPLGWLLWFDEVTKELSVAYQQVYQVTSQMKTMLIG